VLIYCIFEEKLRAYSDHEIETHCFIYGSQYVLHARILMTTEGEFAEEYEVSLVLIHEEVVPQK
jgi:hypothetical protein